MKFDLRKIFVIISIVFISFMIIFYGSRMAYYYIKEHNKIKTLTLIDKITSSDNLINNESIIQDGDKYYFNGKNPNNYIFYSGLMYRILYIEKDTIYAISDEVITKLKYGETSSFETSYINEWLNKVETKDNTGIFINNLENFDLYLKDKKISLLDRETFAKIGATNSFVVEKDFWVLDNDNALVVTEDGTLTKINNYDTFIGVKPVIKIKGINNYISGDGTEKNPYILEKRNVANTSNLYVGDYILYKNILLRVIEKNEDNIRVMSVKPIKDKKIFSYSKSKYDIKSSTNLGYYLNKEFIKKLDKKDLVETIWNIGDYEIDYKSTFKESIKSYIGLPKIGDYFIQNINDGYLLTPNKEFIYVVDDKENIYINTTNNKLNIYPTFGLKKNLVITKGKGLKDNPYVIGG